MQNHPGQGDTGTVEIVQIPEGTRYVHWDRSERVGRTFIGSVTTCLTSEGN